MLYIYSGIGKKDGVTDYAVNLSSALDRAGEKTLLLDFSWLNVAKTILSHKQEKCAVNIQYPCVKWKKRINILLFIYVFRLFRIKTVLTLHEYDQLHPARRLFVLLLIWASHGVVFVNYRQRENLLKAHSFILAKKNTAVVLIAPNIKSLAYSDEELFEWRLENNISDSVIVSFFGFVYPSKMPDEMLLCFRDLVRAHPNKKMKLNIFGEFSSIELKENFIAQAKNLGVEHLVSLYGYQDDEDHIQKQLASSNIIMSLFQDGVSSRRGSFLTALNSRQKVITTKPADLKEIRESVAYDPSQVLFIDFASMSSKKWLDAIDAGSLDFVPNKYAPPSVISWNEVCDKYNLFWSKIEND